MKNSLIIRYQEIYLKGLLICILALAILSVLLGVRLLGSKVIVNCSILGTKDNALKAIKTHPGLDRNHNGIPCERLP